MPYSSWVVTLQKTEDAHGENAPKLCNDALYLGLKFSRVKRETRGTDRVKQKQSVAQTKSGSYHSNFTIGEASIVFKATTMPQLQKEAERLSQVATTKRVEDRIATLKDQYGSFQTIPAELLLSISPKVIAQETQEVRDRYFKILLAKYKKPESVPVDEISKESDVVLLRGYSKRLGYYLCLAKLDATTSKKHGFKSRYFFG